MIIDNEVEVELEEVEEEAEETEQEEVEVEVKQEETLNAKEARLERQLAQTRKKMGIDAPKKETKQSDDFGLAEKGYLKQSGFKATEFDFVEAELKKSGDGDIEALLENPYFQSRLENHRELSDTANATPTDGSSKGTAVDSVDYWKGKEDAEIKKSAPKGMLIQVVNARLAEAKSGGQFYDS